MTPKAEQDARERETIIQWDAFEESLVAWTADPKVAKKWRSMGWPVKVFGVAFTMKGKARSWIVRGIPSNRLVFCTFPRKKPVN